MCYRLRRRSSRWRSGRLEWQLERKAGRKRGRHLSALIDGAARAAGPREAWSALDADRDEFRRVTFSAEFVHARSRWSHRRLNAAYGVSVEGTGAQPARLERKRRDDRSRFWPEGKDPPAAPRGRSPASSRISRAAWAGDAGILHARRRPRQEPRFHRDLRSVAEAKDLDVFAPFYVAIRRPRRPAAYQVGALRAALRTTTQYALTGRAGAHVVGYRSVGAAARTESAE